MELKQFLANQEQLKLVIMNYESADVDIVHFSSEYMREHWSLLSDSIIPTNEEEAKDKFDELLHRYLFNRKISELLIILYLMDLNRANLNIYQLSKMLKRVPSQYSATYKEVSKLQELDIVRIEEVGDNRDSMRVHINKKIAWIYGDDEFRQAQLDDWEGAKKYISDKLDGLKEQKEKLMQKLEEQEKKMKKERRG